MRLWTHPNPVGKGGKKLCDFTDNELALVAMALQPRGHRADLADAFLGFLSPKGKSIGARLVVGDNKTAFVFTAGDSDDREFRIKELGLRRPMRCLALRRISSQVCDKVFKQVFCLLTRRDTVSLQDRIQFTRRIGHTWINSCFNFELANSL